MHKCASRVRRFLDGDDGRPHYTFNVEPKVLSVAESSVLRAGDVIVSVGSTFPSEGGKIQLTFERENKRVTVTMHSPGSRWTELSSSSWMAEAGFYE